MYYSVQIATLSKIESDFKEIALVSMNKVKIPKKHGGNHTKIIKLSELITTEVIKEEMIKVAGDRMLDPPPRYSVAQIEPYNVCFYFYIEFLYKILESYIFRDFILYVFIFI